MLPGKFNVLVTTYEFIMRDRAKLCRLDWKYIVIDEAQRLKERQSKLSRDLDVFRAQRRLLLTGTPLQVWGGRGGGGGCWGDSSDVRDV